MKIKDNVNLDILLDYGFDKIDKNYEETQEDITLSYYDYAYNLGHTRRGQFYYYLVTATTRKIDIYASKPDGDGGAIVACDVLTLLFKAGLLEGSVANIPTNDTTVNITEKATYLANQKTREYCKENNIPFVIPNPENDEATIYADEAQKLFDDYYDNIYSILQTKQILAEIDTLRKNVEDLTNTRDTSLVLTKIDEARMWTEKHFHSLVKKD